MLILLKIITNKYFLIFIATAALCGFFYYQGNEHGKRVSPTTSSSTKDMDKQLESLNTQLGIANSQLVSESKLNSQLSSENADLKKQMDDFTKKYKLNIQSIDDSTVSVSNKQTGAKTITVVEKNLPQNVPQEPNIKLQIPLNLKLSHDQNQEISYSWQDNYGRFKLIDPDIFTKGDEIFTSQQYFKIVGEIYKQSNGDLETRRTILQEVYPATTSADGNIVYKPVIGSVVKLVGSQFTYTQNPNQSIFHLRPIMVFDSNLNIGLGAEFLNFHGFGVNAHTAFDLTSFSNSSLRVGVAYSPNFKLFENVAIGASVGTPFNNFGKGYNVSLDLIFYLGK